MPYFSVLTLEQMDAMNKFLNKTADCIERCHASMACLGFTRPRLHCVWVAKKSRSELGQSIHR